MFKNIHERSNDDRDQRNFQNMFVRCCPSIEFWVRARPDGYEGSLAVLFDEKRGFRGVHSMKALRWLKKLIKHMGVSD